MSDSATVGQAAFPRPVSGALALTGLSLFIAPVRSATMGGWEQPLFKVLVLLALCSVAAGWLWGLSRRTRWLRWFTIICGGLAVFAVPEAISYPDRLQVSLYLLQCFCSTGAALFLLLPSASQWFSAGEP